MKKTKRPLETRKENKIDRKSRIRIEKGHKRRTPLMRKAILTSVCVILILSILMLTLYFYISVSTKGRIYGLDFDEQGYDCILILGAKVYDDGCPCDMLADRLEAGASLYFRGAAKKIIVSGDHGQDGYDEVNPMKNYLMNLGIPDSDIFMDHAGFSTYDSVYRAINIFGAKNIIIVTQKFHLPRAMFICDMYGASCVGVFADSHTYAGVAYNYLREVPARIKDSLLVLFSAKPKYLGEKIDLGSDASVTNDR